MHPMTSMEPLLPSKADCEPLEDLAVELLKKASHFAGTLNPVVRHSVGDLVRSMNCYYSNLIEGHDTRPRDIDKALSEEYSSEPEKRSLQKEAVAHIAVQKMIDDEQAPDIEPLSSAYAKWIHKEFCSRLPDDLLWVENADSQEKIRVVPGQFRDGEVSVGRHVPPHHEQLDAFLKRFDDAYSAGNLSGLYQVIAIAASHHRFAWIHPFYDGNGRVIRLMSYAALKKIEVGSELWSVARGLARNKEEYKALLQAADSPRQGSYDGRGSLSQKALIAFCALFLKTCIDQVEFMSDLLDFSKLSVRIERHIDEMVAFRELPKRSFPLLREALIAGQFERGKVSEITGLKDRSARDVLYALTRKGLLVSDSPRGVVRLGFPIDAVERWFPKLYPSID